MNHKRVKVLCKYLGVGFKEEVVEECAVLEGGSISSKMDGVEGASDLVRCEDVRSCAIDYAIRRDRPDSFVIKGWNFHRGLEMKGRGAGSYDKSYGTE